MTPINPHCHETVTLRRQLASAERELEHRAEVASIQADRYARLRGVALRRAGRIEALEESRAWWATLAAAPILPTRMGPTPRSTSFPSPEDYLA